MATVPQSPTPSTPPSPAPGAWDSLTLAQKVAAVAKQSSPAPASAPASTPAPASAPTAGWDSLSLAQKVAQVAKHGTDIPAGPDEGEQEADALTGALSGAGFPGGELATGAFKGIGETAHTLGRVANAITGDNIPGLPTSFKEPAALASTSPAETIGKVGEGVLEFVMGDEALKSASIADKLGIAQKVTALAEKYPTIAKLLDIGLNATRTGVVGAAQTTAHGHPEEALQSGVITGATGGALEGAGKLAEAISPTTKAIEGEVIPVRASENSGVADTAEKVASAKTLQKFDVEQTQPAARRAGAKVAAKVAGPPDAFANGVNDTKLFEQARANLGQGATDSEIAQEAQRLKAQAATSAAKSVPPREDAFGFGAAGDTARDRSKTVFQKLDDLSEGRFGDAQQDAADARGDFTAAGKKAYREAMAKQDAIFDEYKDQFTPDQLKQARADWKQSQGMEDLRVRFNRTVHPTPIELAQPGKPDIGYVNGKTFREQIVDAAQNGEFERAGFSPSHIQLLEEIGKSLENGNNLRKLNPLLRGIAYGGGGTEAIYAIGLHHPGMLAVEGGAAGGSFIASKLLGKILTNPQAAETFAKALRSSASVGVLSQSVRAALKPSQPEQ